jgi:hypothetical protein
VYGLLWCVCCTCVVVGAEQLLGLRFSMDEVYQIWTKTEICLCELNRQIDEFVGVFDVVVA